MRKIVLLAAAAAVIGCSVAAWANKAPPPRKPVAPASQPTSKPATDPNEPQPVPNRMPGQPAN